MHRLRDLHRRVPGRRHDSRGRNPARRSLAARQGPIDRPIAGNGAEAWLPLASVTARVAQARTPVAVGRPAVVADGASATEAWQVWRSMKDSGPTGPEGALPGRVPGRHGRRPVRRADRRRALRRRIRRRRRGQPVPVGVRLDLHRAVRGRVCRRGVLDEPIAIRTLKRFAAEHGELPPVAPPAVRRDGEGRRSSAAARPGCRRRTTSPGSATRSRSSRRCPCRAA